MFTESVPEHANHLNLNIRGLPLSATLAINERCHELRQEGQKIYKLGLGQSPFPVPEIVQEELRRNVHQKDYLPVKGLRKLRDAVADYHYRKQGVDCTGDDVMIAPGSKELMFLLQMVYYGDLVIPTPSWVSYAPQAHIAGRPVRWLATNPDNGWRLSPDELEKLCKQDTDRARIVILNYPSNPTGFTYNEEELEALAAIAREYQLILLSDEIYGELHHKGDHKSIARYYPEGTIVSGGLSKWCGAGGWRLGTFTFPKTLRKLQNAMAVVASETYTSTCAPIQYAAVKAFEGGADLEDYLSKSRALLSSLGNHIASRLQETGIKVGNPEGGFYLFPDFSPFEEALLRKGISGSISLCEQLLEDTGVAMLPGSVFGRPESELTARIAYVDFDGELVLKNFKYNYSNGKADLNFLNTQCGNVVIAIDLICEWLKEKIR
ncbi:MAG: aminotransferase class I/II-fold pyridoxal phosphate-dependent enzyme [Balneolales bacterium]